MKKRILTIVLLSVAVFAFAYSIGTHFEPASNGKTIKIDYDIPDFFEEFELPEAQQQEVSVERCFKMKFDGVDGECRFLLYADTGVSEKNFWADVRFWDLLILRNIVGKGAHTQMKYYEREGTNFNADTFGSCIIQNPTSEFAKGYQFAMLESAYKKDMGICYRVFLTNNPRFWGYVEEGKIDPKADFFKYRGTWWFDTPDYVVERGFPD